MKSERLIDPWHKERVKIALKAFDSGSVIYSPKTKQWYSPRSYVDSGEQVTFSESYGGHEKRPDVVLHHPGSALVSQSERALREQEKLVALAKMLEETYHFERKDKKRSS